MTSTLFSRASIFGLRRTALCASISPARSFPIAYTHNKTHPEDRNVKTSKQLFEELMGDIEIGKAKRAPELVALLGKNVNKASSTGDTPLIHCIKFANTNDSNHLKLLKAIVESPFIDVNQPHHQVSNTAMHFLLGKNQYNNQGSEPITITPERHTFSNDTHVSMLNVLLKLGADPNLKNKIGDTPLHIAADHGDVNAVRTLVNLDYIDATIKDAEGKTAAERAQDNGHITVAEMLRNAMAKPFRVVNKL